MALATAALVLLPRAGRTQTKQDLLSDFNRERENVLAYVDAMPDSALGFRPTAGVRSFAEQIEHILQADLDVASVGLNGTSAAPIAPDTATILHQKAALRAYAGRVYDYVLESIRSATPVAFTRQVQLYGQPPAAAGRQLAYAHEHAVWTLGATIPYLRLNGVTPPAYKLPL